MSAKPSIRTPLGRARGLGSAKDGTHHWWMQRVTSVALAPLSVYLLWHLGHFLPDPFALEDLVALLGSPLMSVSLILFILAGWYHAWLGVQVIVEDYVHGHAVKTASLLANALFFLSTGAAALWAVLYIAFVLAR